MSDVLHIQAAILGAGPAGLMAAEVLARSGVRVTVFDAMPSAGRKFLMAGRGGLNLTHSEPLPQFFAQADVFVLPSRYDGWGVVVNQALGAGLPILVSDQVGAGYDLVREGQNGFVLPVGDVGALASSMQRYVADPSLREAHGTASRKIAADWTPECGAERWVRTLKAVGA